ncbi:VCBS repeat-containing protein [Chryseolinea sp. H1M3-3]|uniref:VCBS repeat-containing protein n=1 Tax=Chryseolinea sp. H1M3-3 TaxID=3034144 RepID=UPI0023EB843A|nr:VCBS repeat-containing protein [Chryseolinea sp. H1M3-3]
MTVGMRLYFKLICSIILVFLGSCSVPENKTSSDTLFKLRSPEETGINFINQLDYTEQLNTYTYKNFYSGGGVGLGDFNNDGLIDIFFSGNLVPNKLYLNKGNWKFEDISTTSGVSINGVWTTGISVVDINGDGLLDVYLCKSGPPGGARRHNELFINNGDLTFTERAKAYGLAFEGLSTHAAFFDFDKDGDLDCYLLNNSFRSVGGYDLRVGQRNLPDPSGGNKLLRNDNGKYVDVSEKAGIYTSAIGFGLGITIGDLNKDGWQDMYVSNDFFEKDYLYINNADGTFKESLEEYMQEISLGSMGADMADINNDAFPEVFVTEMLPEHDDRLKTTTQFESWDKYNLNLKNGYFRQFSRNVLQFNNGNNTFSEIARLSGVHATDWSWGALIFDMDNDGQKDIFVANGIYKELLNQDYVNYASNPKFIQEISSKKEGVITKLIDSIPSTPISNYVFHNQGNLSFKNKTREWGLDVPTHSNGSAYGDLDNDGDLDLILNNVNMPSMVFENQAKQILPRNNTLSFVMHGDQANSFALGTKITIRTGNQSIYQELSPMRGFMSTVDNRIHVGVGNVAFVDTIVVAWPNDKVTMLSNVKSNQVIHLYQKDASVITRPDSAKKINQTIFDPIPKKKGIAFCHVENEYVDFDRDRLLFNMVSNEGPCLCTGDVNGDGREDFYVGGAKDQSGRLFIQKPSGAFAASDTTVFEKDKESEDTDCIFFDADSNGSLDLYVTSGGVEFSRSSPALLDRLYLNDGSGKLKKINQPLPVSTNFESTGTVVSNDYDKDGDQDLFVGARLIPFAYGTPANGYILNNDGKGNFTNVTKTIAVQITKLGMITGAQWIDVNNDGFQDLVIVGEWMPIKIFVQENGKFVDRSSEYGFDKTEGWYNAIEAGDFNKDGYVDLVVGNHGINSRFKASRTEPVSMYINDFDQNGTVEHIITQYDKGKSYPMVLRQDMVTQIPSLKKKYLRYKDYKEKTMEEIFSADQRQGTTVLNAYSFQTAVWLNTGKSSFLKIDLPIQAQFFPVYALHLDDYDYNGTLDILMGGNLHRAKPETGIYAGGYGLLLSGDGHGGFKAVAAEKSGLKIKGEIRGFRKINNGEGAILLVAKNNDTIEVLNLSK